MSMCHIWFYFYHQVWIRGICELQIGTLLNYLKSIMGQGLHSYIIKLILQVPSLYYKNLTNYFIKYRLFQTLIIELFLQNCPGFSVSNYLSPGNYFYTDFLLAYISYFCISPWTPIRQFNKMTANIPVTFVLFCYLGFMYLWRLKLNLIWKTSFSWPIISVNLQK